MKRRIILTVISAVTLPLLALAIVGGWMWLTNPMVADASPYRGNWQATENGYVSSREVHKAGQFCTCPAYECGGVVEATTIAYDGYLRQSYEVINAPVSQQSLQHAPIETTETCIQVAKGDVVQLHLTTNQEKSGYVLTIQ